MAFKLQPKFVLETGEVNVVGEELGFDWNVVCDAIAEEEFYGQDGDGSITVQRREIKGWQDGMLKTIFEHLFATHPHVDAIIVMN